MTYDIVIEKKVTPEMMTMSLWSLLGDIRHPKIMIIGKDPSYVRKQVKTKRLQRLIKETEKHGIRFDTTEKAMDYLMS